MNKSKLSEEEVAKLFDSFERNKDLIMKAFVDDLRLVTWIAWGIGAIFPDCSLQDMMNYMKNPDMDELAKFIQPQRTELFDITNKGFIMDSLVGLYSKDNELQSFLGIENQIKFSRNESLFRLFAYLCALNFKTASHYDKHYYSRMQEANDVWIFPLAYYRNRIEFINFPPQIEIFQIGASLGKSKVIEHYDNLNRINGYFFFVGKPDYDSIFEKGISEREQKLRVLLYILDSLFAPKLKIEERLNNLRRFDLYLNEDERNAMEKVNQVVDSAYESYLGELTSLLNETTRELNSEKRKSRAENEKFQQELNSKQQEINLQKQEIDVERKNKDRYKSLLEKANEEIIKLGGKPIGEDEE